MVKLIHFIIIGNNISFDSPSGTYYTRNYIPLRQWCARGEGFSEIKLLYIICVDGFYNLRTNNDISYENY